MTNPSSGQRIGMSAMEEMTIIVLQNINNQSLIYQVKSQAITIQKTIKPSPSSPILEGNSQTLENLRN